MIIVSEQQVEEVLLAVLSEGNPLSTIQWEFDSGFNDINKLNREDFCAEVVNRLKTLGGPAPNGTVSTCCGESILMECSRCHLGCWPITETVDRYTPEERAVIEAAVKWRTGADVKDLFTFYDMVERLLTARGIRK